MKIALVHDDFVQAGGAESLFAQIGTIYKDAPIYTSLVNWDVLPPQIEKKRIHTSFLQKIPLATLFYKALLPLYPLAFESFNFSAFDLVISSTTRFAKSIITQPGTVHICYINSIPRFLWHSESKKYYFPKPLTPLTDLITSPLKRADKVASARPDYIIANSKNVASQVKKYYNRDAQVIYPPVDTKFFHPPQIHNWKLKNQNYYLIVSRLVKWKRIDLAIAAAKKLNLTLLIVGEGPAKGKLKLQSVGTKVEFLGRVEKTRLRQLYQNARGLIVTQEEDFGIAVLEAQACGIPVIAFNRGGQKETVKEGVTGLFFRQQEPQALEGAINASSAVKWDLAKIRSSGARFSEEKFKKQLRNLITSYVHQK